MEQVKIEDVTNPNEIVVLGSKFNMYGTPDRPLFLASDIAEIIGYSTDKIGQMLENVDDDEKLTDTIYRGGQRREMWFLTEYGLYELLMQSRKPFAKQFKYEIKNLIHEIRAGKIRINRVAMDRDKTLFIENATIIFRNFSGDETKFNKAGDRNFCVIIDDPNMAQIMSRDGWNIKTLTPRDEGDEPKNYVNVAVRFNNFPPKMVLISGKTHTILDEESVNVLDNIEIENVDLTIRPYTWEEGKIKAYLKDMYITIKQDMLAAKYSKE
ncbi:MAG: Bro-N domain-containing protein [Clostridiaceae bacterium]|nr:Bro-N domain-containing protein [Clostridiaceae bacterium]